MNDRTGLLAVEASIDRKTYPVTIDIGSAWTWFRPGEERILLVDRNGSALSIRAKVTRF